MQDMLLGNVDNLPRFHKNDHPAYEFYRRELVPFRAGHQSSVAMYEIPPGKSNVPYHYHMQGEETFYIIGGQGVLKTPTGDRTVGPGDFCHFPPGAGGAHKLTNTSDTETLVYLDFDTEPPVDVAFYPDSGKVGIFGEDVRQLYRVDSRTEYYDGE